MTTSNALRIDFDPSSFAEETIDGLPPTETPVTEWAIREELGRLDVLRSESGVLSVVVYKKSSFALAYFASAEDALEAHRSLAQKRADGCLHAIDPNVIVQQSVYTRGASNPRLSAPRVQALEEAKSSLARRITTRRTTSDSSPLQIDARQNQGGDSVGCATPSRSGGVVELPHANSLQGPSPPCGKRKQKVNSTHNDHNPPPYARQEVIFKASPSAIPQYDHWTINSRPYQHSHQPMEALFGRPMVYRPSEEKQIMASSAATMYMDTVGGSYQVPNYSAIGRDYPLQYPPPNVLGPPPNVGPAPPLGFQQGSGSIYGRQL